MKNKQPPRGHQPKPHKHFVYEDLTCNHRCANQGGRGNNVQFMATNDDVLFPREIAWQLSLIAAFHSS